MTDPIAALRAVSGNDLASGATTLPNIPSIPTSSDPALVNILSVMKAWMEQAAGAGATGFASKQELISAGVISTDGQGNVTGQADMRVPPVPTGLMANGAMTNILVQWDTPVGKYANHGYTEVWAAETDNFSGAVMVGQAGGFVFSHSVGEDSNRYYWIRFVSTAGVKGPYNGVSGTHGQTAQNVNYLIDTLTEAYGSNGTAPFFQVDQPIVVNGVTIPPGIYMKSAFIASGSITTAQIKNATIDSAQITGKLTANQINADQLNVTNGTFTGQLIGATGTFSGSLAAASGTFVGELQAATGTFGGRLMAGTLNFSSLTGTTEYRSTPGTYYITLNSDQTNVRYQIIAGGGGGGAGKGGEWNNTAGGGGGGGAGQYVTGTVSLYSGAQIRIIVGSGGGGAASWAASGNAGTYSSLAYWNGDSWINVVEANPGGGGSGAPNIFYDNADGDVIGGGGGGGYPAGNSAPSGEDGGTSASGGSGASTVFGTGGNPGWPNNGWGTGAIGFGSGGGGGAGYHGWRNSHANEHMEWFGGGGPGGGGKAIIELYSPNTVVLRSEFITLDSRVTALEQRLKTAGIP